MRNRGIVIELTALLDVILIMLFWVMMSMEQNNEKVKTEAAEQVAEYEQKYLDAEQELEDTKSEYDLLNTEFDKLLDAISDSVAVANQKAVDSFADGHTITIKIRYDDSGVLAVYSGSEEISRASLSDQTQVASAITAALDSLGISENDVILCSVIYDGSVIMRQDTNLIRAATEDVKEKYSKFYCNYISTSR